MGVHGKESRLYWWQCLGRHICVFIPGGPCFAHIFNQSNHLELPGAIFGRRPSCYTVASFGAPLQMCSLEAWWWMGGGLSWSSQVSRGKCDAARRDSWRDNWGHSGDLIRLTQLNEVHANMIFFRVENVEHVLWTWNGSMAVELTSVHSRCWCSCSRVLCIRCWEFETTCFQCDPRPEIRGESWGVSYTWVRRDFDPAWSGQGCTHSTGHPAGVLGHYVCAMAVH